MISADPAILAPSAAHRREGATGEDVADDTREGAAASGDGDGAPLVMRGGVDNDYYIFLYRHKLALPFWVTPDLYAVSWELFKRCSGEWRNGSRSGV